MRARSKPRGVLTGGEGPRLLTRLSPLPPLGALCCAGLVALAIAAAAQQTPVFPTGVELIAVDVTVVDGKGRPVPGLAPEDFSIEVGGRPRRVVSAQFLKHAEAPGRFAAEATLELGTLAAGAYRLRAVALEPGGSEAGRVERPLRLQPRP